MPTLIHVSPHPDDESIAASCTLLALRDAGWDVINVAVSLGRRDPERRRRELDAALGLAGFRTPGDVEGFAAFLEEPTGAISRGDELGAARRSLGSLLARLLCFTKAELIVGPHPRDAHHGHQTVARTIREAVWRCDHTVTWWMWSVWADLPHPTLVADCDPKHLDLSARMLECHHGELARSDYLRMHQAVRAVNAVRGVEKAFGYGSSPASEVGELNFAELLTEVSVARPGRWNRRWQVGPARLLDPADPLLSPERWTPLTDHSVLSTTRLRPLYRPWLMSLSARLGWPGPYDAFTERPRMWHQLGRFAALSFWSTIAELTTWKPRRR